MAKQRDWGNRAGLAAPVERLIFVDELERGQTGRFQSQSLPGHLLHIVLAGAVRQWAEGRPEVFGPGVVVWYHENEPVHGEILRAPWRFITINFLAPALPPPPDDRRVLRPNRLAQGLARKLLTLWRDGDLPPLKRQLACHRVLIELLQHLLPPAGFATAAQPAAKLWWRIEKQLRARLEDTRTLADLQRLSGLSLRTLNRACQAATDQPPMRRIRSLRLGYACALVQHSDLPITEIAFRVGFARPQEFSREYHRHFGITPRDHRRRPPDYRRLERPRSEA